MQLLLLLAGAGGLLYLLKKQTAAAAGSPSPAIKIDPLVFNPIYQTGGTAAGKPTSTQVAQLAGTALSAATGIPGFDKAGAAIAGLFGKGRKQADTLVDNYQTPLNAHLATIAAAWNDALHSGKATADLREQVKVLYRTAVAQFNAVAVTFDRAGAGGIETMRHVVEDILIADMDRLPLI